MKITSKTLTLDIEHDVQVGHNGAIEATLMHHMFIFRNEKHKTLNVTLTLQILLM